MANCQYQGPGKMIIKQENLVPEFFDLKTKIAGNILQKFSTYQCQLAIIGDFSNVQSQSLKAFIYESNKIGRIFFVNSFDEAINALSKNVK